MHVTLAISLFLPSLLLPFSLRLRPQTGPPGRAVAGLLWLQANGTLLVGGGLAVTGIALLALLGAELLRQPWLLVALVLYALNLAVSFFVQRPNLRRLLGMRPGNSDAEQQQWRARARRQRYVSYLMAAAIGLIAFLMSTKPSL